MTRPEEFEKWWFSESRLEYLLNNREDAKRGWVDCMLESHTIEGPQHKLRGIDAYCSGWNAAVDLIIKETTENGNL